jgi:photosystem II stability/assembly factor-like uncharacterized protein
MRAVTGFAVAADGALFAGGTSAPGRLALFRKPPGEAPWQKLGRPVGLDGESFDKWYLGALAAIGPRRAFAVLFRGTEDGGAVLRTDDGGDTWATVLRSEEELYRVCFAGPERGWLGGSRGGLWASDDGGANWKRQENPEGEAGTVSCLAFARDGRLGAAALGNGKLLLSDGRGWRVVEGVGPGYSMPDAAVVDAGRAYVLGADGALARFNDPSVQPPP